MANLQIANSLEFFNKLIRFFISFFFLRKSLSGVTDTDFYRKVVVEAVNHPKKFNKFRKNKIYNVALEHTSVKLGNDYYNSFKDKSNIIRSFDEFKKNDLYGSPKLYSYENIGKISPSTLRYIKVLSDLKDKFKNLDDLNILEIGIGYGGQCRIIDSYNKPATYTLVDIKPVLLLAERYLEHYVLHSKIIYKTLNEIGFDDHYDLVISNYAFTELPRNFQDAYLDKIILRSERGYITYNECIKAGFESYKSEQLLDLIPNSKKYEETPTYSKP